MQAQDFINDALTDIGVTAAGETPSTDEQNYALRLINQVLDSWSAEALPIYQITREVITMTGAASYALATRPVKIKAAEISSAGGLLNPVKPVTAEEWSTGAGTSAVPALWCDGGFPSATVYLRPAPTSGTMELYSYRPLSSFSTLTTDLTLPPGYQLALRRALGLELALGFGRTVTPDLASLAESAKTAIEGLNAAVLGTPGPQAPPPPPAAGN
jgi:hypothetical protein